MKYRAMGIMAISLLCFAGCDQSPTKKESMNHTTKSGLEYQVITQGAGQQAQKGKKVVVHYTGWLDQNGQQGKKFDSSFDRNQPFSFTLGVGQVIAGWDEGVACMNVGSKYRFTIPANLAYGSQGAGSVIPPHAKLIFEVELLEVK